MNEEQQPEGVFKRSNPTALIIVCSEVEQKLKYLLSTYLLTYQIH